MNILRAFISYKSASKGALYILLEEENGSHDRTTILTHGYLDASVSQI